MPDFGPPPSPQDLQFQHAEPVAETPSAPVCVVCKQPIGDSYFQAQGHLVCPLCAERIRDGQQSAPAAPLLRAALYGAGAALAGCAIYALVAIVLHAEIGLIAILVGWMVGTAIRRATDGAGGRPQQILAVALTYFAITTSYIPVILYHSARTPARVEQRQGEITEPPRMPAGTLALYLLLLAAIAPFLTLTSGISAWISLFILFIGLQRAWKLTERREIQLSGPHLAPAP